MEVAREAGGPKQFILKGENGRKAALYWHLPNKHAAWGSGVTEFAVLYVPMSSSEPEGIRQVT